MPVNTPRADYLAHFEQWERCRDCFDGSDAVKAKGEKYLPKLGSHQHPVKGQALYNAYRMRALFYNGMARTVEGLAGGIFQKAVTTKAPTIAEKDLKDITLTSTSLESLGLRATQEVLKVGRHGILVEMADDAAAAKRPYWVTYHAESIISWRTERFGGDETLTRVVLREACEEEDPKDPFTVVLVERFRVLELVTPANAPRQYQQVIWHKRKTEKGEEEWVASAPKVVTRRGVPLPFIPFVFLGATSVSPNIEKPPLLDLADVNLSHYRTMADLEHGRHWVALPTPWVRGAKSDGEPLAIGSGTAWELGENGQAGMLEFTGQGLGALERADDQKRQMMATLGARLLESQKAQAEAARTVELRHGGEHATLRTIAQSVEQALTLALQWHVWWVSTDAAPDGVEASVELNKDFFGVRMTPDELRSLVMALQAESISFETFWHALLRGDVARPGVTAEEERQAIAAGYGARTPPGDPEDDPDPADDDEDPVEDDPPAPEVRP